jgi:hypothetical protein
MSAPSPRPDQPQWWWAALVLEEIRKLIGELVRQGGGSPPDPLPPWER